MTNVFAIRDRYHWYTFGQFRNAHGGSGVKLGPLTIDWWRETSCDVRGARTVRVLQVIAPLCTVVMKGRG